MAICAAAHSSVSLSALTIPLCRNEGVASKSRKNLAEDIVDLTQVGAPKFGPLSTLPHNVFTCVPEPIYFARIAVE